MRIDRQVADRYKDDKLFTSVFSTYIGNGSYILSNCLYDNCFFTCDKQFSSDADALIFHAPDLERDISNDLNVYENVLKNRSNEQIWIIYNDEPTPVSRELDKFEFNWTMSFYTSGDTYDCTYGCTVKRENKATSYNQFIDRMKKEFSSRANEPIWFVSNCEPKSRLHVASYLAAKIDIFVTSNCYAELKKINPGGKFNLIDSCKRLSKCETEKLLTNKYYLAFESQNCVDYITEKFWRSLSFGLIPIVFQPSKASYERVAPNNSYIHLEDFNNDINLLVNYLNKVSNDFQTYFKHVQWQYEYKILYEGVDVDPFRICQACIKLNTDSTRSYYSSISDWFNRKCI